MDIGTLTGQVAIEDQLTDKLTEVANHVRKFGEEFDGVMGTIVIGAGAAAAAIAGMAISITALGTEGSKILGVENAFDHLAESAGTTGDALRGGLLAGVKGTIDDMEAMQSTTRLLGSGMKLTADQAQLMGQAARELGKATGGDATSGLNILSSALTTGRTRQLQMQGILVDVAAGEKKFADSLGITTEQLSEAGKLEGKRIAILDATKGYVDRLGESQLSFAEKIKQGEVAFDDWIDELRKGVASSTDVNTALDTIGTAISTAFGEDKKGITDALLDAVNAFSRAVTATVPYVVDFAKGIVQLAQDFGALLKVLYDYRIIVEAVAAGLLLYNSYAVISTTTTASMTSSLVAAALAEGELGMAAGLAGIAIQDAMAGAIGAVKALWAVLVANPIIAVTAAIAALTVAFVQWKAAAAEAKLATETLGAQQDVINKAIADGAPATIKYADAIKYNSEMWRLSSGGAMELDDALKELRGNSGNTHTQLEELNTTVLSLGEKGKLTTPLTKQVADAIKSMHIEAKDLPPALLNIANALDVYGTSAGKNSKFIKDSSKEIEAATTASIAKTEELWDQYFGVLDKMSGDSLETQLDAIDRWEDQQKAALSKTKKFNEDYQNQLQALESVALAKRDAAYVDFNMKLIKDSEKVGEEGAAAVAKGFAGMPLVLTGLAQSMGSVTLSAKTVAMQGVLIGDTFTDATKDIDAALTDSAKKFVPLNAAQQTTIDRMHELGFTGPEIATKLGVSLAQVEKQTFHLGETLKTGLLDVLKSVPQTLANAFTGGGGLLGGLQSIGSSIGSVVGGGIGKSISSAVSGLGSLAGPIGAAIGSLVGPLIGMLAKIGGPSEAELAGRKLEKSFEDAAGGFDKMMKAVGKAYEATGHSSAEAQADVKALLDAEKQGPEATQKWIDKIKGLEDAAAALGSTATHAADELGSALAVPASALASYDDLNAKAVDLRTQLEKNPGDTGIAAQLKDITKQMNDAGALFNATIPQTQQQADALASAVVGDFASMIKNGVSFTDAVMKIAPAVTDLTSIFAGMGDVVTDTTTLGGAGFVELKSFVDLASDTIAGPAINSVQHLGNAMADLETLGLGNKDTFEGLGNQIGHTFQSLIDQGKDGNALMIAMRDPIQKIWEEQQKYGTVLDDSTQKMVDQAVQQGIVGPEMEDINKQLLKVMKDIDETLKGMSGHANDFANSVSNIPSKKSIEITTIYTDVHNREDSGADAAAASMGGRVTASGVSYYATGTDNVVAFTPRGTDTVPAMLSPGEEVDSVSDVSSKSRSMARMARDLDVMAKEEGVTIVNNFAVAADIDSPAARERLRKVVDEATTLALRRQKRLQVA